MSGTGFNFIDVKRDKRCEEVKWRKVFAAEVDIIQENGESQEQVRKTLNGLLSSILYGRINENGDEENNIKVDNTLEKAFRLAQLSSQYLYHCQEVLHQRSDSVQENIQDTVETLHQAHKKFTKRKETRRQLRRELKQIDNLIAQYDVTLKTLFPEVAKNLVKNIETGEVELKIPVEEGENSKASEENQTRTENISKSADVSYIRKLSQEYSTYLRWERKVKKIEEEAKQGKELKKKLQECEELIEKLQIEKREQNQKLAVSTGTSTSPLPSPVNISTKRFEREHRTDSERKVSEDNVAFCAQTNTDRSESSSNVLDSQPTDNNEKQNSEVQLSENRDGGINEIDIEREYASNKSLSANTSIDGIENESEYASNKRASIDTSVDGIEKESEHASNKGVSTDISIDSIQKESEHTSNKRVSTDTSINGIEMESEYASNKRVSADTSIDSMQKELEYASYKRVSIDTRIECIDYNEKESEFGSNKGVTDISIDGIDTESECASNERVNTDISIEGVENKSDYASNKSVRTDKRIEGIENESEYSSNMREQTLSGKGLTEGNSRDVEWVNASSYENVEFDDDIVNFELTTSNEFLHQIQKNFNSDNIHNTTEADVQLHEPDSPKGLNTNDETEETSSAHNLHGPETPQPQKKNICVDVDASNLETKNSGFNVDKKVLRIANSNIEVFRETESYSKYNHVSDGDSSDNIESGNVDAYDCQGTEDSVYGNEKEDEESILDNSRASHYSVGADSLELSQHQFGVHNSINDESEEFKMESTTDVDASPDPLETTSLVGISENSETGSTLSMRISESNSIEDSLEVSKGAEDSDSNLLDEISDVDYFEGEIYAEAIKNRII